MIGIFDSGAGGLTITAEIQRVLPRYDFVYFGDTARYPYGNQSPSLLRRYAEEDAALLLERGATLIVIACNSASAAAADHLRSKLSVPVMDVIGPAITAAKHVTKRGRIGVIGTKATVSSGVYEQSLRALGYTKVVARATPMFVPLVEERWWKHPESMRIIRRSLKPLKEARIDTLILACTHYPLLQPLIERAMGKSVAIVNPARAAAEAIKNYLDENPALNAALAKNGKETWLVSSDPQHFAATARWWLGRSVKVEEAGTRSE